VQDARCFELTNAIWVEAKQVAEQLLVVLTESRRLEIQMARKVRKPQRKARKFQLTEETIAYFPHDFALA
jgi:hypothetical protein